MTGRALFLDRDGVINEDYGYVGTRERFVFKDGIFALANRAVDRGYRLVVVTNQSGIARGLYDVPAFARLTAWMADRFAREGAPLAAVLFCPFLAAAPVAAFARDSVWRKPAPGMILEAVRRLGLDPVRSAMLGDQPSDMAAARTAGVGRRLLLDGEERHRCGDATATVRNLDEAGMLL